MKFICSQQELNKALNTVSKAVTSRTTIPILKGILLKADKENKKLEITASDLDISIEKKIETEIIEEGSIVVPARLFSEIIRKLPQGVIDITSDEMNQVTILSDTTEFKIVGMDPTEFPEIGEIEEKTKIAIEKETFRDMIRKTSFAASIDESKGIIVGVLIEMKREYLTMAALDGFRMAVVKEDIKNENELDIVIAARILNEINKIIADSGEDKDYVELLLDDKKAVIRFEDCKIVLRLLDGVFLSYGDILPKSSECKVRINKERLMDSVERAILLAKEGRNNLIKLSIEESKLTIFSKSESGNLKEEILIHKTGSNLDIGFNSKYMLDALKVIDEEEIMIEFNTNITPAVIKPVEGDNYSYLILPVRIAIG